MPRRAAPAGSTVGGRARWSRPIAGLCTAAVFVCAACASCEKNDGPAPPPTAPTAATAPPPLPTMGTVPRPPATGPTATGPVATGPRPPGTIPTLTPPGPSGPKPSAGCGKAPPAVGFLGGQTIAVAGAPRTFGLYVPAGYDPNKGYPLIFALHGDGGDGAGARAGMKLEAPAREGAIFVYPDGRGRTWDLNTMPPEKNPDVLFFDALVAKLGDTMCLARGRVFVTGHSNGAYMANQLGCWRGGVVRAIAPHSGGGPYDSTNKGYDEHGDLVCPGSPVAALVVHGQADGVVAPSEGQFSLSHWRRVDGCQASTAKVAPEPCVAYTGCARPVVSCSVPGLGHGEWSQAAQLTWDFFASLP